MDDAKFSSIVSKLIRLQKQTPFYRELYCNLELTRLSSLADFEKIIPIISKAEVFDRRSFLKIMDPGPGTLYPSAGTHQTGFSMRFVANQSDQEFQQKAPQIFDMWFCFKGKRTLILNAYPLGVSLPEGPYTVVNTNIRDDIIISMLDLLAKQFEMIIIIGQPHFIKHLIDLPNFKDLPLDRSALRFVLGGAWFPYTFEVYILKKLHGENWHKYSHTIKSTFGTAETGLGVLIDLPENIRSRYSKIQLNEIIPLIYQYDPSNYYLETVNKNLLITTLKPSAPELIRYQTGDIATFPCPAKDLILLWGRGRQYAKLSQISHNLFLDFEQAQKISGNFFLKDDMIILQLNRGVRTEEQLSDYFSSILSDPVNLLEYDRYPFAQSLDRKPIYDK